MEHPAHRLPPSLVHWERSAFTARISRKNLQTLVMRSHSMRRAFRPALAILMAGALAASGMAWMRPGWLPAWARFDVEQLASWARLGAHSSQAPDEDEGDDG